MLEPYVSSITFPKNRSCDSAAECVSWNVLLGGIVCDGLRRCALTGCLIATCSFRSRAGLSLPDASTAETEKYQVPPSSPLTTPLEPLAPGTKTLDE